MFQPFWPPKTLPKPLQNREKIDEKSKLTTKAKKWGEMSAKSAQEGSKRGALNSRGRDIPPASWDYSEIHRK